jgi:hypothetical protein
MSNSNIIFVGDYIRDWDGSLIRVMDIDCWDLEGDAELKLENGLVINSRDVDIEDILSESEVIL